MTTPESPDQGVLVMVPPLLLLATQPVVDADVGLPLASYDLIPDGEGATAVVDPPLSGTVDLGDVIRLWLVGDATFLSSAFITDVNAKTRLRIPKGRLYSDQINKLFYTITRGSSNVGKSEPDLTVLYNKIRPALKDRFPEIDGHSEIELRLADEIKNGVGPDFVSAKVWVSYPYCRAYDTITLKCNGEIMTYQVRPDEAPQPPNPGSADPITVCFTVTRAYLESAVRPGGKLHFSCTCTDQIGNTPDTDAVWSATQTVDEDLAGLLLPAALLREQLNDPDDDLSLIDLEKLGPNPLLLVILTADSHFQVGYTVNAVYTATLAGQPDVVVRVSGTVEADEFGQKKPCVLEVPNDKVPAGRTVTVMYELFDGATLVGRSKAATALVVGENTIEIDAPRLLAPATIPVDALDHEQGVNVRVDFAEAQPGDKAQLVLRNPLPGSPEFLELSLDQTFAIFNLDVVFLGLWHGKAPQLSWDLIRGGKVIAESLPLVLTVSRIVNEDPRLSMPVILNYAEQDLYVTKLLTTDKLSIARWPLQTAGVRVWLRLDGTLGNGQLDSFIIWKGDVHRNEPSDVVIPLTAALVNWLNSLKDGSTVTITFAVNLDKVVNKATAVKFPLRVYTVQVLEDMKPVIDKAEDSKGLIPDGGATFEKTVTLTGFAAKGRIVEIFDGTAPLGEVVVDEITGIWTKLVTGLSLAKHSFTAKALGGQTSTPRTFTVVALLTIDTSQMNLNGMSVKIPSWATTGRDSIGNTDMREPLGGQSPYTYHSSNDAVAPVTQGKVIGNRNGPATITVRDSLNQEVSYPVMVSNVYFLGVNETPMTASQALIWYRTMGNVASAYYAIADMERVYGRLPISNSYWLVANPFPAHGCIHGYYAQYHSEVGIRCAYDFEPASTWYLIPT